MSTSKLKIVSHAATAFHRRHSQTAPPRIQLRKNVTVLNKFETLLWGADVEVKRGCILPDDRIVLCGSEPYLYVCNPDGKRPCRVLLQMVPFDIAVYDQKRAVVSGEAGYQIIDLETMKSGPLFKPGGVCTAVTCTKGNIVIANDYCKLTYLTLNGETIKTINTTHTPYTLASNKDGCVFWTTWDNDEVHFIEANGTQRFLFSSSELKDPVGVSVDKTGCVYAIGKETKNVHKISNEGNTSKIVLKENNGLSAPRGMSFSPTKMELMVINDKKTFTVYKL